MYAAMYAISDGSGLVAVAGCPFGGAPVAVKRPRRGRTVLAVQDASGV